MSAAEIELLLKVVEAIPSLMALVKDILAAFEQSRAKPNNLRRAELLHALTQWRVYKDDAALTSALQMLHARINRTT